MNLIAMPKVGTFRWQLRANDVNRSFDSSKLKDWQILRPDNCVNQKIRCTYRPGTFVVKEYVKFWKGDYVRTYRKHSYPDALMANECRLIKRPKMPKAVKPKKVKLHRLAIPKLRTRRKLKLKPIGIPCLA